MSDTFITVIAILLAVVLLVVVPLQVTSQRVDTMSKLDVDTLTSDLPVDYTKPIIERYAFSKISLHLCEFCIPLK